jgi:NTE family protein
MSGSVDLVFEGGGVKGVGLAGAYGALEEEGWEPECVAGASAGAITAALVAAGYTGAELREEVLALQFGQFKDDGWEDRLPVIGKEISVLRDFGVYEGRRFLQWMTEKLDRKGVRTFSDLKPTGSDDPKRAFRLQVIASDVTRHEMLVLPRDAHKIGSTAATLSIAYAVRMSMSIPIFFEPVRHSNDSTGLEQLIVDGGMLSNFPVWLFDAEQRPRFPTFGLLLVKAPARTSVADRVSGSQGTVPGSKSESIIEYLKALAQTLMEAHDRMHVDEAEFARTIAIPTLGVRTTDFDLSRERARELYDSGYDAAKTFLGSFDFETYIAAFRSGNPAPTRRASLAAAMRRAADQGSAPR